MIESCVIVFVRFFIVAASCNLHIPQWKSIPPQITIFTAFTISFEKVANPHSRGERTYYDILILSQSHGTIVFMVVF
jgi:hypothetical protein